MKNQGKELGPAHLRPITDMTALYLWGLAGMCLLKTLSAPAMLASPEAPCLLLSAVLPLSKCTWEEDGITTPVPSTESKQGAHRHLSNPGRKTLF